MDSDNQGKDRYWERDISGKSRQFKPSTPMDWYMGGLLSYDAMIADTHKSINRMCGNIRINSLAADYLKKVYRQSSRAQLPTKEVLALADNEIQMSYGRFIHGSPDLEMQKNCDWSAYQLISALDRLKYPLDEVQQSRAILEQARNTGLLDHAITHVLLKYQDEVGCEAALALAEDIERNEAKRPDFTSHRRSRDMYDRQMRAFDQFAKQLEDEELIAVGDRRVLQQNKARIWDIILRDLSQQTGRGAGRSL